MPPPNVTPLLTAGIPLFSHEGGVDAIAFSPDGTRLVAADTYSTTMWNSDSGKVIWRTSGGGVAEFLDEESVVVSGYSNQPRIKHAANGQIVAVLAWYGSQAVGVPADGGEPAVAVHATLANEKGAGLIVIDRTGATLANEGSPGARHARGSDGKMVIATLAASPDGKLLVASERRSKEMTTRAVASRTLEERWQIDVGGDRMAFSPDGARLGLQQLRGVLLFIDPLTGKEIARAPQKEVESFAFSADGSRIAIAAKHGVEIVDAQSFETVMTLEPAGVARDTSITAVAFSPDGKRLAAALPDRLTMFELESREERGAPSGHTRGVWAISLPGEGVVVTRGPTETKTWRIASGELQSTQSRTEEVWPIPALAATPEGALLDAEPGAIRIKNARGEVASSLVPTRPMPQAAASMLVATAAGKVLAVLPPQGEDEPIATLRIFALATGVEVAAPAKLPAVIRYESPLAISSDGRRIAVSVPNDEDFTSKAVVLDAATGEVVGESASKRGSPVVALAFLDASRLLVATPGSMHVLTIGGGSEPLTLRDAAPPNDDDDGDDIFVSHVVVSPDGRLVAFGSEDDCTVRVCESGNWNEAVLCGVRLGLKVLCFSADSRTLAAGLQDGSLRVWSIA